MNLRSALALFALVSMPLSGCIFVDSPPPTHRNPGDVTFLWTFQGQGCAMVPAVKNVKVIIPGQTLMNDGVYDCSTSGTAGIVLHDFKGAVYSYTLQGRDYNGTVLYTKDGTFTVDGSVTVSVDLQSAGGPSAYAYLVWTFPPNSASMNPTCVQAGVTTVNVSIDQGQWVPYACADGQSQQGVASPYLTAGSHNIELSAVNATGYEYFYKVSTLPVSNTPSLQQYDLDWSVGGATVKWNVTDSGGLSMSCAAAGITTVYVNFQDSNGDLVYGNTGDPQPCANLAIVYFFLKPGTYSVVLRANGSGSTAYQNATPLPRVTVAAGVFTDSNTGVAIDLRRVQ